jgi:serine/threonine-protein kinase
VASLWDEAAPSAEPSTRVHGYSEEELQGTREPGAWSGGLRALDVLGGYQLLRRLGAGGMAEVFLARRRMREGVDKLVALKLVRPTPAHQSALSQLFLTEARVSATLQHPNVIQVFDVGRAAGRPFMAMEYVHGRNGAELLQRLRTLGALPPVALAVSVAIELCRALEYLHGLRDLDGRPLRLVHRDVSPGNLLVGQYGEVKLVDMGVAAASIATGSRAMVVGKRAYMSPEQARGERPRPAWDVYGLGLVLYELLTLERAFGAGVAPEACRQLERPPSALHPGVPPALDALVRQATEADPAWRVPDAATLRQRLERVRAELPPFELGRTMRELFGPELEESRRELESLVRTARRREGWGGSRTRRLCVLLRRLVPPGVRLRLGRPRA